MWQRRRVRGNDTPKSGPANLPVHWRRHLLQAVIGRRCALAPEYNLGRLIPRSEPNACVTQSARINPLEQSLSPAEQHGRDSDVQLIDAQTSQEFLTTAPHSSRARGWPAPKMNT